MALTPIQKCMREYGEITPPKASLLDAVQTVVGKGDGPYKTLCFGKIVSEWGELLSNYLSYDDGGLFQRGTKFFKTGSQTTILPKILNTTHELTEAATVLHEGDSSPKAKWTFIRKALEGVSDTAIITTLLTASLNSIRACTILSFACDTMDLKEEVDTLIGASDGFQKIRRDVTKPNPLEQGRYALLRLIKLTASISAGIITLLGMVLGTVLVQPITLLVLSTINVVFSLTSKVYEEMMTHKIVARQIKSDHENLAIA